MLVQICTFASFCQRAKTKTDIFADLHFSAVDSSASFASKFGKLAPRTDVRFLRTAFIAAQNGRRTSKNLTSSSQYSHPLGSWEPHELLSLSLCLLRRSSRLLVSAQRGGLSHFSAKSRCEDAVDRISDQVESVDALLGVDECTVLTWGSDGAVVVFEGGRWR